MKVTIVEPGLFRTSILDKIMVIPTHPLYTKPSLPNVKNREFFTSKDIPGAETAQGAKIIYQLASVENPPLRVPVGKDALDAHREGAQEASAVVNDLHGWSEGLPEMMNI